MTRMRRLIRTTVVALFAAGAVSLVVFVLSLVGHPTSAAVGIAIPPLSLVMATGFTLGAFWLLRRTHASSSKGPAISAGTSHASPIEAGVLEYRRILIGVRSILEEGEAREWLTTLDRWLAELDSIQTPSSAFCNHLHRSWFATGGMGSLGDIVLVARPRNAERQATAQILDQRLTELVRLLYVVTTDLSTRSGCPPLSRGQRPNN